MLRSISGRRFLISGVAALILGPGAGARQEKAPATQPKVFEVTHELLQASYPEVFGKGLSIRFSAAQPVDDDKPWGRVYALEFTVTRFAPGVSFNPTYDGHGHLLPTPQNTTFLDGSCWVDIYGRLFRFNIEGELANDKQNDDLKKLVASHPEWSEQQAVAVMKEKGARYGPADKDQFLQAIHLEKFEPALGHLQIKSAEFGGLTEDHEGNFALLDWTVRVEGHYPDGAPCAYVLSFEPFKGKLTLLTRVD